jgi:hypothetical protein
LFNNWGGRVTDRYSGDQIRGQESVKKPTSEFFRAGKLSMTPQKFALSTFICDFLGGVGEAFSELAGGRALTLRWPTLCGSVLGKGVVSVLSPLAAHYPLPTSPRGALSS